MVSLRLGPCGLWSLGVVGVAPLGAWLLVALWRFGLSVAVCSVGCAGAFSVRGLGSGVSVGLGGVVRLGAFWLGLWGGLSGVVGAVSVCAPFSTGAPLLICFSRGASWYSSHCAFHSGQCAFYCSSRCATWYSSHCAVYSDRRAFRCSSQCPSQYSGRCALYSGRRASCFSNDGAFYFCTLRFLFFLDSMPRRCILISG